VIPTYVLKGSENIILVITRELDDERVEILWLSSPNPRRVGMLDWSFRANLDDAETWTRIA